MEMSENHDFYGFLLLGFYCSILFYPFWGFASYFSEQRGSETISCIVVDLDIYHLKLFETM